MTDELRALMLLYKKSKEGQQKASKDRTDAQAKLRESVAAERKHSVLLESLQPLIHQVAGGPEALIEADRELAETKLKAEEKAEGKGQARGQEATPASELPKGRAEGKGSATKAPEAQASK